MRSTFFLVLFSLIIGIIPRAYAVVYTVPGDFDSITESLTAVEDGDTVEVLAAGGPYDNSNEIFPLKILNDNVTLVSPDGALLRNDDENSNVIHVGEYDPFFTGHSGVTIQGFSIETYRNGIVAMAGAGDSTNNLTVRECSVEFTGLESPGLRCMIGTYCGQIGAEVLDAVIEDNVIYSGNQRGISLSSGGFGVFDGAQIQNNYVDTSYLGIQVVGQDGVDELPATVDVLIQGNFILGPPGKSLDSWGIDTCFISALTIADNLIFEVSYGLNMGDPNSDGSLVQSNLFQNTAYGILLYGVDNSTFRCNRFLNTAIADVYMENVCAWHSCGSVPKELPVLYNTFIDNYPAVADWEGGSLRVDNYEDGVLVEPPVINEGNDFSLVNDFDVDDVADCVDNCPDDYNPTQLDGDGDEWGEVCDCEDSNPDINPGADEICDNGIDDDCDALVDSEDPDCPAEFILELDASFDTGYLNLDFTLGAPEPAIWATFLVLTYPSVWVVPIWVVPIPTIYPPTDILIDFPFPNVGWVGVYSVLFTFWEGVRAFDYDWVYTDWPSQERRQE